MKVSLLVCFVVLVMVAVVNSAKDEKRRGKPDDVGGKPDAKDGKKGKMGKQMRKHGKGPGAMAKSKRPKWAGDFGKSENEPNDFKQGDTFCRVLGKSGAIAISKYQCRNETEQMSGNETTTSHGSHSHENSREMDGGEKCTQRKAITIRMDSLEEKDENGIAVGRGKEGHVFKNFARQEFSFDIVEDGDVPNSNVTAKIVIFSAHLASVNSNLTVNTYIIKEDGYIMNDNETQDVSEGMVKFSITLEGWDFCGCDKDADGQFVDLALKIASAKKPKKLSSHKQGNRKQKRGGKAYELDESGSAKMILSEKVEVDGVWMNMPDGFPMMEQKGADVLFKFRFPRFSDRVFYDPSVAPSNEIDTAADNYENNENNETNGDNGNGALRTHVSLAVLGCAFLAFVRLL